MRSKQFRKAVNRIVDARAEHKWNAFSQGAADITNAGQTLLLWTSIANGTSANGRLGDEVRIRNMTMNITLANDNSAYDESQCRIIVGCFLKYQTASVSIGSLMEDPTDITSLYNRRILEDGRWIPMYDRILNLTGPFSVATRRWLRLTFNGKRLPRKVQKFNSSGVPNFVYFIMIWGTGLIGTNYPFWQILGRYTFVDY